MTAQEKMVKSAFDKGYSITFTRSDPRKPWIHPSTDFRVCPQPPGCGKRTVIIFNHKKDGSKVAACACGFRKVSARRTSETTGSICPCGCGDSVPSKKHTYAHGSDCAKKMKKNITV